MFVGYIIYNPANKEDNACDSMRNSADYALFLLLYVTTKTVKVLHPKNNHDKIYTKINV